MLCLLSACSACSPHSSTERRERSGVFALVRRAHDLPSMPPCDWVAVWLQSPKRQRGASRLLWPSFCKSRGKLAHPTGFELVIPAFGAIGNGLREDFSFWYYSCLYTAGMVLSWASLGGEERRCLLRSGRARWSPGNASWWRSRSGSDRCSAGPKHGQPLELFSTACCRGSRAKQAGSWLSRPGLSGPTACSRCSGAATGTRTLCVIASALT